MDITQVRQLQRLLEKSSYTVVITGAGISITSGVPGMSGLDMRDMDQFLSTRALRTRPESYYSIYRKYFLGPVFNNGPSLTHRKLAELEAEGRVQGIVTTNFDGLYRLAGSNSVAEIQGGFWQNVCLDCGMWIDDIHVWNHGEVPRYPTCGGPLCNFLVYSHIGILEQEARKTAAWVSQADLIVVTGAVGNYAGIYWNERRPEVTVAQINPERTFFSRYAALDIRVKSDEVFALLA